MRGDSNSTSTIHQSGHYESCLNSTCSRSPSPIRRHLWEPKHPPPEKIKDHVKNVSPLRALGLSKSQPRKDRTSSPFHCRPDAATHDNYPRCNRDPLFTYTINKKQANSGDNSNNILVTIQQNIPRTSPTSSRSKTPEPRRPHAPHQDGTVGNLTLQLELNSSKTPPTVSISSKKPVSSETSSQIPHSAISSAPSSTCTQRCQPCGHPSPRTSGLCSSTFKDCPCLCVGQAASQSDASCDATCQSCPRPCLTISKSTEDKATSPFPDCCTPKEIEIADSPCQVQIYRPCHRTPLHNREDRASSPIITHSRSPSPTARVSINPAPAHTRSNSVSSQGSIEIESDEGVLNLDWEGHIGPIDVKVPIPISSRTDIKDDHIHSHDPQLEAFYASCDQSQSKSSPPSPAPEWLNLRPPWNPCSRLANCCPSEKHSSSSSPCRTRSRSTTPSRTPNSRSAPLRDSNSSNDNTSCLQIYDTHAQLTTNCRRNRSDEGPQNQCGTPRRLDHDKEKCPSQSSGHSGSPTLTVTPPALGSGQLTIQWQNPPSYHNEFVECTPRRQYEEESELYGRSRPHLSYCNVHEIEQDEDDDLEPEDDEEELDDVDLPCETLTHECCTPPSQSRCTGCPLQPEASLHGCSSSCASLCGLTEITSSCTRPNYSACCPSQSVLDCCCDDCPCCCSGNYSCRRDTQPAIDGINQCGSLPPHLQSDWSASLRCSPNQLKTKPILYRDADGHEHIMFADGSVEHLSHHCKPIPPTLPPILSPAPPRHLLSPPPIWEQEYLFHGDGNGDGNGDGTENGNRKGFGDGDGDGDGDGGEFGPPQLLRECTNSGRLHEKGQLDPVEQQEPKCTDFSPRSGDIVIRSSHRLSCLDPGKDDGKVAFVTRDYLDLRERDSIVRLGKFDTSGRWCASRVVEMYMRGRHGRWMLLGKHAGHECLRLLQPNQNQKVRTPSKNFQPRLGDLVISTIPGANSFHFWNPKQKNSDCHHSQLLLRAYIGRPRVVDQNHNLACCVSGHLPVGYAELYVKVRSFWLFLGRDDHMFSEYELSQFS